MSFCEKLKTVRLSLNLSQSVLAEKTGISERSLYTYEQTSTMPRGGNIRKLADALNVSVGYLLDDEETDPHKNIDQDIFIANSKNVFGYKGAREVTEILSRASALLRAASLTTKQKNSFSDP